MNNLFTEIYPNITKVEDFLRSITDVAVREEIANRLIVASLKAKGFHNYESFQISGEEYFVKNILSNLKPKLCVDVGANFGDYAHLLLDETSASVICFEPLQNPFKKLEVLKNKFQDRLFLENKGVGDKNEFLDIFFNENEPWLASFSEEVQEVPYLKSNKKQEVELVTLDSYFYEKNNCRVDFLKIDTEGFEWEVLRGAKDLIANHRPVAIQIAFNWHQLFKGQSVYHFSQFLKEYLLYQKVPNGLILRDPKDYLSNIYQFSNFVFLRRDIYIKDIY